MPGSFYLGGTFRVGDGARVEIIALFVGTSIYPSGVPDPLVIAYDFGTGTEGGGNGFDGLTEYATTSAIAGFDVTAAYPESCTIYLPGFDATDFRCWQVDWP
jgi:hypothetical protein